MRGFAFRTWQLVTLADSTELQYTENEFILNKCDLSRENVPYGIRSNGRTHGMWTDDKRIEKPFKTDAVNGWTASEKFRTVEVERLNG